VLTAKISQIYPGGGTEIFQGLDTGYQELKKNLNQRYTNHIILITDGRTYGDEESCLDLAKTAADQGITIHTLGIGDEWNDDFLDALATITGGNSEFAETTNGIQTFLKEKFGRIQNTVVNNLTLDINTPENIELRYAFRMNPETSSIMLGDTLALGDIPKEQSLSVLMEFLIESTGNQQEVLVLDGTLHLMMPSAPIPNFSSRLTFSRPVVENPEPVPPPQILIRAMSRLSLYRLQEMARKDMQNGDITKATQRLKNLATQLLMSGEENLAQTVMLELDHINRNQEMSENAQKQIKYGTRALVLDDF
jgi:Ca-activated chloride channel family protein